jgi:hypothetical protein
MMMCRTCMIQVIWPAKLTKQLLVHKLAQVLLAQMTPANDLIA